MHALTAIETETKLSLIIYYSSEHKIWANREREQKPAMLTQRMHSLLNKMFKQMIRYINRHQFSSINDKF